MTDHPQSPTPPALRITQYALRSTPHSCRRYDVTAPLARALDLVGERWTLLLIRQLLSGDQRYADLHTALLGMSSNLLSSRLRRLQAAGIIERVQLNGGSAQFYRLTPGGEGLAPVVWALDAWAQEYLEQAPEEALAAAQSSPAHDRCGHKLSLQWYCSHCGRAVRDTELEPPPPLL